MYFYPRKAYHFLLAYLLQIVITDPLRCDSEIERTEYYNILSKEA